MTTIRGRRRVAALLTSTLAGTVLGLVPASAQAAENAPPVPQDDVVRVVVGSTATVDLLANDTDPDGDDLAICRLGRVPRGIIVSDRDEFGQPRDDDELVVLAPPGSAGKTFVVDYFVCDFEQIVPATLTVKVVRRPQVKVSKVADRPGLLRVGNPSRFDLRFLWGSPRADRPDGRVALPAGTRTTIRVRRESIVWIAVRGRFDFVDIGRVKDIRLPRNVRPPRGAAVPLAGFDVEVWSAVPRG